MEVRFEINNSPTELTNALQKACTTEQEGYAFECFSKNIETNDYYLDQELLASNLELLPIRYGLSTDEITNIKAKINIVNDTNDILPISSSDLMFDQGYNIKKI